MMFHDEINVVTMMHVAEEFSDVAVLEVSVDFDLGFETIVHFLVLTFASGDNLDGGKSGSG